MLYTANPARGHVTRRKRERIYETVCHSDSKTYEYQFINQLGSNSFTSARGGCKRHPKSGPGDVDFQEMGRKKANDRGIVRNTHRPRRVENQPLVTRQAASVVYKITPNKFCTEILKSRNTRST